MTCADTKVYVKNAKAFNTIQLKKCRREKVHKKDANPTQWIKNASYSEHIGKIPTKSHTKQKGVMEVIKINRFKRSK